MNFGKMTKAELLSTSTFDAIFEIQDAITRAVEIVTASDRASELRVSSNFNKLLRAYESELKKFEKEQQDKKSNTQVSEIANITNFGGKYKDLKCGAWIANNDGVKAIFDKYETIACYCPILPINTLKNVITGKVKTTLAYKMHDKWETITVDKGVISSNSKIVSLADYGIPITTETARPLVKYLADVEHYNISDIPVKLSTSKMGWLMGDFFPYSDNLIFDGEMEFGDVYEALTPCGDFKTWLDAIKQVRTSNRIEPLFMMSASFASPLLKLLNVQSFCVNLWGETEGGKTVTSKLSASVWANPATGKFLGDFNATDAWIEIKQDFLSNLPLILDDSATVKDKNFFDMSAFIYNRCKEKGKGRSNKALGIREETTWRQIILINGEQPAIYENMQGGAINRTLDINCGLTKIYENPRKLCEIIDSNYGFAGRKFIDAILQIGKEKLTEIFEKHLKRVPELGKMDKQSASLACILTADEIATDYIFKDNIYIDLEKCADVLCDTNFVSENERCYDFIMEQASVHSDKFIPLSKNENTGETIYKSECWGCYEDDLLIIIRSEFEKLCSSGGFSAKKFLDWAKKTDKIICDNNGNPTRQKKLSQKFKNIRCVFLKCKSAENTDFDALSDNEPF